MIGVKIDVVEIVWEDIYVVQECLFVLDNEEHGKEFGFEDVRITQEFGSNASTCSETKHTRSCYITSAVRLKGGGGVKDHPHSKCFWVGI